MKVKAKTAGFDGTKSYDPGDTIEGDTDHVRTLLANGLADPEDEAAENFLESNLVERYTNPAYDDAKVGAAESASVKKTKGGK